MVEVASQVDFDAMVAVVQALDARLTVLEALPQAKALPDNVKVALKVVLEWYDANV